MIALLLFIMGSLFFTCLMAGLLSLMLSQRLQVEKRVVELMDPIQPVENIQEEKNRTWFRPIMGRIESLLRKYVTREKEQELRTKIRQAGTPFNLTPIRFIIVQIGFGIGLFFFILLLFFHSAESQARVILAALVVGGVGFYYPVLYLKDKQKRRTQQIKKLMADFFDMVNISIEAGLGLDGALNKVARQMKGPLSEEFLVALDDMKLGKSKREAFTELRERVPSDQFQSVISALIQADQMGIGMTKVLRAQTARIREQKRQEAREQAMKAPVKMMIPMVLFIFPTLFIVLLGPLIVTAITEWL
ncbi:type II secretion system F family protein [Desertibacillus haloalkaliphilus]|uniref:type II secretion system F family protein n=1 Tax=Desertibacillus haloalkaliphilus TaxID=1328930 RepID=UPI001C272EF5|nr:type II secretion system F family protein [Desertibacillus haloalkaliphilus]MBU8908035.1 type II secretion system F family protein [Desertibacillus haloalkaliphilus]